MYKFILISAKIIAELNIMQEVALKQCLHNVPSSQYVGDIYLPLLHFMTLLQFSSVSSSIQNFLTTTSES